jgi:peptidoglycan/xylan/chitin deacetylase (PgdA/CDA1 family)
MIGNPPPWPNGARCAAAITFDVDADSMVHLSLPETAHTKVSALSWGRYDIVAVPRIVELYKRYGIRQTFFMPGWVMEHYPSLVETILDGGNEIGLHGYIHELANAQPTVERERYWLERSLESAQRIAGSRPVGWRAPMYAFSHHTAALLADLGFTYDSSLMGDDVPYVLETDAGEVLELPVDWATDDWPQYVQSVEFGYMMPIRSPDRGMEVFRAELDAAVEYGGMFIATWHPFVSGRLARLTRIAALIEHIQSRSDIWLASLGEIVAHVNACVADGSYVPRREKHPIYAEPVEELAAFTANT